MLCVLLGDLAGLAFPLRPLLGESYLIDEFGGKYLGLAHFCFSWEWTVGWLDIFCSFMWDLKEPDVFQHYVEGKKIHSKYSPSATHRKPHSTVSMLWFGEMGNSPLLQLLQFSVSSVQSRMGLSVRNMRVLQFLERWESPLKHPLTWFHQGWFLDHSFVWVQLEFLGCHVEVGLHCEASEISPGSPDWWENSRSSWLSLMNAGIMDMNHYL